MKTTKCPQDKPKVENEWPKRKFKHTPKNVDLEKAKKKKKVQMRCFSFGRFVDFDVKITW